MATQGAYAPQLATSVVPPMSGNPADQYGPNPYGQGPQQSAGVQAAATPPMPPTSNVLAFQHPGSNPTAPGAGTGSGVVAPPPPPGVQLDPNQQYIDAFNQSLAKQRQAIDSALAANLQSMGHRRDLAAQTIVKGSGDVKQALANQQATNVQADTNAAAALSKDARPQAGVNQGMYADVIKSARSTETANEPLLQLGAQANYDTGASQLNTEAMHNRAAVDQQQSQFALQQLAHSQAVADQQRQQKSSLADQEALWKFEHPGGAASADPYYAHKAFDAQIAQQQSEDKRVAKLSNGSFGSAAELADYVKATPQFGWVSRAIAKGGGHPNGANGPTYNWDKALDVAGADQRMVAALYATGVLSAAQVAKWVDTHKP